jgi:hypothetical protein
VSVFLLLIAGALPVSASAMEALAGIAPAITGVLAVSVTAITNMLYAGRSGKCENVVNG